MIKLLNNFNNYSFRVIKKLVPSYTGMLRVKAGRPLINHLLKMVILVKGSIETSLVKVIVKYVRFLFLLRKRNGTAYTAKYLKASVSLLMQALSGEPHQSTRVLGLAVSRTRRGIPRFIPAIHRRHIRSGNLFYIRLWLSLISIYRVLDFVGKLDIRSIIRPSNASINFSEVMIATQSFKTYKIFDISINRLNSFWIGSSSPTSTKTIRKLEVGPDIQGTFSTAFPALLINLLALKNNISVMKAYLQVAVFMQSGGPIIDMVKYLLFYAETDHSKFALEHQVHESVHLTNGQTEARLNYKDFSFLGKLGFKIEPAGKIRVFAMADAWTQWLVKPLHSVLFNFLKTLSTDATFNQTEVVDQFNARLVRENIRKVYSFDLTAATDRIPVNVQALILSTLFNKPGLGEAWAELLIGRWYQLPFPQWSPMLISRMLTDEFREEFKDYIKIGETKWAGKSVPYIEAVRYATGQPMGALSSWAMLAVTHHIMVRIASIRAGYTANNFDRYLVLGDDLVIADERVANNYLLLAKEWDIGINLSKSVLSRNGSFEFAKRFFYKGNDVSGLSFKEMAVAYWDIRALFQMMLRVNRFRNFRISEMLNFLGHGYKAVSRINAKFTQMGNGMRKALLLASYPGALFSTIKTPSEWILSNRINRPVDFDLSPEALKVFKDYLLKAVRNLSPSKLPPDTIQSKRTILSFMPPDVRGIICYDTMPSTGVRSIADLLSFATWPMLFSIHSDNKRLEDTVMRCFHSIKMGPDALNTVWEMIDTLETHVSRLTDQDQFRVVNDVITLGKCKFLKRAEYIRSTISFYKNKKERSIKPS